MTITSSDFPEVCRFSSAEDILSGTITSYLTPTDRVLDMGCGTGRRLTSYNSIVGVDVFQPYLDVYKEQVKDSKTVNHNLLNTTYTKLKKAIPDLDNFDVVLCIDFVEHLTPEKSRKFIELMETIAKRAVIIFTPEHAEDPDKIVLNTPKNTFDIQGNDDFQTHKSAQNRKYYIGRGYQANQLSMSPGGLAVNIYDRSKYYEMLYVKIKNKDD